MTRAPDNCVNRLNREWAVLRHREVPSHWIEGGTVAEVFARIGDEPDGALGTLITRHADGDLLAGRVVLQAVLGKLVLLAARDPRHGVADYVAECWLQLCRYPLQRRPVRIAANLVLDTRRALWAGDSPLPSVDPVALDQLAHERQPDGAAVIRTALKLGLIDGASAACLIAVYYLGLPSHEAARSLNTTAHVVRWRNARALRRLAPHAVTLAAA
ncbi:RNA polymerase sigma factor [Micropruina sp.]|uniref:RNA polymerase sigma factor n=1 Tax=Micropruina sp. TaxID=2737536 RepID=UPI0039E5CB3C